MISPSAIATQGIGHDPMAIATQGFIGQFGILISLGGLPIGVQLGAITLTFASPAEIALASIVVVPGLGPLVVGLAGAQNIFLGALQVVVSLGRHGFGVPAPLSYLWIKLTRGLTRGITRLVTQWRGG